MLALFKFLDGTERLIELTAPGPNYYLAKIRPPVSLRAPVGTELRVEKFEFRRRLEQDADYFWVYDQVARSL